jgi:uncharacterized protein YecT (DUF1311 family)
MKIMMIALAFVSLNAFAVEDCDNFESTNEINQCILRNLEDSDAELNKTFKRLRSKLDEEAAKKLVTAQKAWLSFRDAQCDLEADQMRGGTLEKVLFNGCLDRLTVERTKSLKTIIY